MKSPNYVLLCLVLGMLCWGLNSIIVVSDARAHDCNETIDPTITTITCEEDSTGNIVPTVETETEKIHVTINEEKTVAHDGTVIDLWGTDTENTIENNGTINNSTDPDLDPDKIDRTLDAIVGGNATDMLTNNGTINGAVNLGEGADTLTNTSTINGNVILGAGEDTLNNTGTITGNVGLSDVIDSDDSINTATNSGTIEGNLNGGKGNDEITNSGTLMGDLNGGDEVVPNDPEEEEKTGDTITNTANGIIEGNVNGGSGNDEITNSGTIGMN